ncbi:PLP-dependent aminotransferase family protein [Pelagicoccus sp. SDUM812005]|uniref:MocR-like pyridoxine biosynthesis transcription factor PdxR n=1 Tax=Pelagicoccus sp. SDUM812005 TaxID=3041257 RepID=UPI00280CD16D|nr:PLP-dependent aminotransferase family protein [Pelagicoccus sp. SDUM812005]MDQ8179649.1 PLP-dependent aminotransferase family protein [Pelagicoccus sp. SDUM812005]
MKNNKSTSVPRLGRGKLPAYQRVYVAFRDAVRSGKLKAGQQVPSSRELALRYGVARITVTQAYEQLIAEGYLETRRGAGTFVAAELPERFFRAQGVAEASGKEGKREGGAGARYVEQPPFLSGSADLQAFPMELWLKLYAKQLRGSPYALNNYGHGEGGYAGLREAIAAHLSTQRGVRCEAGQILILSGSQPGIELVARALVKPGDAVALENPSYGGITSSFRLNGAQICPLPVDELGMRVDALEALRDCPRLVVATPARQFPLGVAMPVGRQAALLEWAEKTGAWILEDDYDSEFRFRGKPLPAMQGLSASERILYLGTFTRSMFPDLRIGYLVVPKAVYPDFLALWKAGAMNPPVSLQATLADFMRECHYARHLRKMRKLYEKRSRWLAGRVEELLGDWFELGVTDGGMHFVGFYRKPVDARRLAEEGRRRGYVFMSISSYGPAPLERDGMMFGFSSFSEEKMGAALKGLREALERAGR